MKKIIYLLLLFTIMSCEKDEIIVSENSIKSFARPLICAVMNTPFSSQSVTYLCSLNPNDNCFKTELKDFLNIEFGDLPLLSVATTKPQIPHYYPRILISTEEIEITYNDIIDSSDLYPYISADKANTVFTEFACQIYNTVNEFPTIPVSVGYYDVEITFTQSDFILCCGSPEDGFALVRYKIWKQGV